MTVTDPRAAYFYSAQEALESARKFDPMNPDEKEAWWASMFIALYNATMASGDGLVAAIAEDYRERVIKERSAAQEEFRNMLAERMGSEVPDDLA